MSQREFARLFYLWCMFGFSRLSEALGEITPSVSRSILPTAGGVYERDCYC